jgi:hypothetical protein
VVEREKIDPICAHFHLLSQGKPMIKYEQMHSLFAFFKVSNYPSKHWNDHAKWEIVESLHNVVMSVIK